MSEEGTSNTGRWTSKEHAVFLEALELYGNDWRRIASQVKTRNNVQVRTHAQKYFKKLERRQRKAMMKGLKVPKSTRIPARSKKDVDEQSHNFEGEDFTDSATEITENERAEEIEVRTDSRQGSFPQPLPHVFHQNTPYLSHFGNRTIPTGQAPAPPKFFMPQQYPSFQRQMNLPLPNTLLQGISQAPPMNMNPLLWAQQMSNMPPAPFYAASRRLQPPHGMSMDPALLRMSAINPALHPAGYY